MHISLQSKDRSRMYVSALVSWIICCLCVYILLGLLIFYAPQFGCSLLAILCAWISLAKRVFFSWMFFEVVSMRVSFLKCKQLCGRDMCTDTDTDTDADMDTDTNTNANANTEIQALRYRYIHGMWMGMGSMRRARHFAHQLTQAQTANLTIKYGNETPALTCAKKKVSSVRPSHLSECSVFVRVYVCGCHCFPPVYCLICHCTLLVLAFIWHDTRGATLQFEYSTSTSLPYSNFKCYGWTRSGTIYFCSSTTLIHCRRM